MLAFLFDNWRDASSGGMPKGAGGMPTKLFNLIDPQEEGGTPTYQEIDLHAVEIPEDHPALVAARKAAEDAKEEAIQQRKRYQKLRDQLAAEEAEEPATDPAAEPEKPQPEPAPAKGKLPQTVDELYAEIAKRFREEQAALTAKQAAQDAAVEAVLKAARLPASLKPVLRRFADNPEELKEAAQAIVATGLRFDDTPGGGASNPPKLDAQKVLKEMGLA